MSRTLIPLLVVFTGCPPTGDTFILPNNDPEILHLAPDDGATLPARFLAFEAIATDDSNDLSTLTGRLISSMDGPVATEIPVDTSGNLVVELDALSVGTHNMIWEVTDADDGIGETPFSLTTIAYIEDPNITIDAPADSEQLDEGVPYTFMATVSDHRDIAGDLVVSWESNIDGAFCNNLSDGGGQVSCQSSRSPGTHILTATVTDTDGNTASDSVTVEVVL